MVNCSSHNFLEKARLSGNFKTDFNSEKLINLGSKCVKQRILNVNKTLEKSLHFYE